MNHITRLLTVSTLGLALVATPACSILGGAKDATSARQEAAHVAFGMANSALEYLEEETANWIAGMADPSEEDLAKAAETVQRLRRAKVALELAEPYVTGEKQGQNEATLKTYIADAASALMLVVDELRSHGVKVPAAISTGLSLAKAYAESV